MSEASRVFSIGGLDVTCKEIVKTGTPQPLVNGEAYQNCAIRVTIRPQPGASVEPEAVTQLARCTLRSLKHNSHDMGYGMSVNQAGDGFVISYDMTAKGKGCIVYSADQKPVNLENIEAIFNDLSKRLPDSAAMQKWLAAVKEADDGARLDKMVGTNVQLAMAVHTKTQPYLNAANAIFDAAIKAQQEGKPVDLEALRTDVLKAINEVALTPMVSARAQ